MTASAALALPSRARAIPRFRVPRKLAMAAAAAIFVGAAWAVAPGLLQAVLLLAGPAALIALASKAGESELSIDTLRIALGVPQPLS
jgi:hypothetical protein